MNGVVIPYKNLPIELLRPIAIAWQQEARGNALGIDIDVERHLADLARLSADPHCLLLVLMQGRPVGYMGMEFFASPVGKDIVANEHYWYVMPEARGRDSVMLLREARRFAREAGANYMLFNASRLASDLHDDVCRLYEHFKMEPFETTYLDRLDAGKGD